MRFLKKSWPMIICGLASLFYVYDYFIQVAPSVMTNQLMSEFHMGAAELGILSACFYYSYTLMQIPAGVMFDRFGARKLLTFSVLISAAGVTIFSQAHHFYWIGIARFMIGFGSSFAFIGTLFLVARWFDHRYFSFIAGLVQLAGCVGSLFGLAPMANLINHYGWRPSLLVIGILTFLLSLLFWLIIRDNNPDGIPVKSEDSWLMEFSHLRQLVGKSQLWWIASIGFLCWVPVAVFGALWGVPYLMQAYHFTNTQAGDLCMPFWLGLGLGSPILGWLTMRWQRRCLPMSLCFLLGIVSSLFIVFAHHVPPMVLGLFIFTLGLSSSVQSLSFGLLKDIVPPNLFGSASGINNMAAILGGGLSQPLVGFILRDLWNGHYLNQVPVYTVQNYQVAFMILPVVSLLGLLISTCKLKETRCLPEYEV